MWPKPADLVDGGGEWSTVARTWSRSGADVDASRDERGGGGACSSAPTPRGSTRRAGCSCRRSSATSWRRAGDHQGAGALPLRLPDGRVRRADRATARDRRCRPEGRPATTAACSSPRRIRRGARQAGPDHDPGPRCATTPASTATAWSSAPTTASRSGTPRPGTPTSPTRRTPFAELSRGGAARHLSDPRSARSWRSVSARSAPGAPSPVPGAPSSGRGPATTIPTSPPPQHHTQIRTSRRTAREGSR